MPEQERRRLRPIELLAVALTVVIAAIAAGAVIGARVADDPEPVQPAESAVDVGFLRDMQVHHAQAVRMSVLVRDRSNDPGVRRLALDIELSQQQQIGQMYGWLASWDASPTSTEPPMQWMASDRDASPDPVEPHHDGMALNDGSMPGTATEEDLARLSVSTGRDTARLYLQLMIPHHQGGVAMADYAARTATDPDVRSLATRIAKSQTAEISALQAMLDARDGPLR